jgi:hypothetical protein
MAHPTITKQEMEDALRRSGYLIEYRVEDVLRGAGYHVSANTSYPDPITQKARELDISAIRGVDIYKDKDWLFYVLSVECVNNPYPIAFVSKEPEVETIHVYDITFSGMPVHVITDSAKSPVKLGSFLKLENLHHYCQGRIATQFCSFQPKKVGKGKKGDQLEWMALHDDEHFDSFRKLCAAMNYAVDQHFAHTTPVAGDAINLQTYYPILVVGGELYDVKHVRTGLELETVDHVHYVQSQVVSGVQQETHIDVVREEYLPRLLATIQTEADETAKRMREARRDLRGTIDVMAKHAAKNPDDLQLILRPRII